MPRKFVKYLDSENIFYCKNCRTQIACLSDVAAQSVHPSNNSAYIFCHAYPFYYVGSISGKVFVKIRIY